MSILHLYGKKTVSIVPVHGDKHKNVYRLVIKNVTVTSDNDVDALRYDYVQRYILEGNQFAV